VRVNGGKQTASGGAKSFMLMGTWLPSRPTPLPPRHATSRNKSVTMGMVLAVV